jgi:Mg-chelatase subunit ChlD
MDYFPQEEKQMNKLRKGLKWFGWSLALMFLVTSLSSALVQAQQPATPGDMDTSQGDAVAVVAPAAVAAPSACPAAPSGLTATPIERAKFCVYYKDSGSNSLTEAQATFAANTVEMYWNRFVNLGFNEPKYSGKLEVHLLDLAGCNGSTGWSANYITTYAGCFDPAEDPIYESAQKVLGHELTHRVQYAHDSGPTAPIQTKFLKEGTARATEDNWFDNLDNWANALTAVSSSFNKQVNTYLNSTNADITSDPMRYNSALLWKYLSEQFGTTMTEPERGIDFFLQVFNANTAGHSETASINVALSALGAGINFDGAFKWFAVANWTKDLTGVPNLAYYYFDEKQMGNPAVYGPLFPTNGGTIQVGTPATFNNQTITRYGIRYYQATPGANCPVITATFNRDDAGPAFYHVVTQKGSLFARHVQGSGASWSQSFLNDGITKVVAIAGSLSNSSQVDVTLSCATPVVDIKLPNNVATAFVGPASTPGKVLAQVLVTNGSPVAPVVAGLTNADFKAEINGMPALITAGGFIQEQYWLLIQAPAQAADGVYDLQIFLEQPGTTTVIGSDTNPASIVYNTENLDHVIVIDRSGSMAWDGRMIAAKDAAKFYVDMTRNNAGLAVVPYNGDVSPAPFAMQSGNATVRTNAKSYINGLTASGLTSIGDGLQEAVNQRASSPTGNPRCSFVLLSDGMENTPAFWSTVQPAVVATGCPVTSIAFGPASDETLMQAIATATGGIFFYNDVFVSSVGAASIEEIASAANTYLDLGSTYEYAQARNDQRQRIFAEKGTIPMDWVTVPQTHTVRIDSSVTEMLFALDWREQHGQYYMSPDLRLIQPDGTIIEPAKHPYDFIDFQSGHLGYRISNPQPGIWQMIVGMAYYGPDVNQAEIQQNVIHYQVIASGRSQLTVELLLPHRWGRQYLTGNRLPIFALVASHQPIANARVRAIVTAPDGSETVVQLFDDGEHGDGAAHDGIYGGVYTRVNQSKAVSPPTEEGGRDPQPKNQAGYRVRLLVDGANFQREALGSFAVLAGPDTNLNGIPDPWEVENGVIDPDGDPDLDGLTSYDEFLLGTDPNNSDTDGGGENDGSEVRLGQDPLNPDDDEIEAPDFFRVTPENSAVVLTYDVKAEYNRMFAYRSTSPTGPWLLRIPELSLTGIHSDAAENEQTYYYKLVAVDADDHHSAVLDSEAVKPRLDPIPPAARILIDGGAPTTPDLNVTLSFAAYEDDEGLEEFEDIVEMMLSNDPSLAGAQWRPFAQNVPWQLAPTPPGEVAYVYARFRDDANNESVATEVGSILVVDSTQHKLYLPLITR